MDFEMLEISTENHNYQYLRWTAKKLFSLMLPQYFLMKSSFPKRIKSIQYVLKFYNADFT